MIALIDYGMGNLHSVAKALERAGGHVKLVKSPDEFSRTSRMVLPGVGAFRDCIATLSQSGMREAVIERIQQGQPYLGICLGMQVLMDVSFEFGEHKGFGLIPGDVRRFPDSLPARGCKIPHMGWNDVLLPDDPHPVLAPLAGRQVYYVHSFYCRTLRDEQTLAQCEYGGVQFAAAIGRDNLLGVQFHPEKSQKAGLALLEAFLKWNP